MATPPSAPEHTPSAFSTTQHSRELCLRTIEQTAWGNGLDASVLELLLEYVQSYRVAAGGVVCRASERGDFMAFIVSGQFRVYRGEGEEEDTIALLGPNDSFGEMALVDDETRSASIAAVEESDILVLTSLDFRLLLNDHPETAVRILFQVSRVLSKRVRFLNQRIYEGVDVG